MPENHRILVIGVGNEYRSDDAVGLVVARRLRELSLENAKVTEQSREGADLMESWKGFDEVIIIDSTSSGAKPGTIHYIDARAQQIPRGLLRYSTHTFSVAEAVELARVMNQLPPRMVVYGIEAEQFEEGVTMSPAVQESVGRVVELVLKRVEIAIRQLRPAEDGRDTDVPLSEHSYTFRAVS